MEFMSYIILFGGLYCIYNFYKMKIKGDLEGTIVLPKDARVQDCENQEEYIKKTAPPVLVLGIALTLESIMDIYATRTGSFKEISLVLFAVVIGVLIWVLITLRKNNKKYFGKILKK